MLIVTLMLVLQAEVPPPADLAALLEEAERNNPEIAAALARQAAIAAVPSQREAPPDPVASVSYTNDTVTGLTLGKSEFSALTFKWAQELPYPGKLRLAGDSARREAEVAQRRIEVVRVALASKVKKAYAELYRNDSTVSILEQSRQLLKSYADSTRARYESGEGILQNVLKAQTELVRLDIEIEKLAQERRSLQAELNALAGRAADAPLGRAVALPEPIAPIDTAALEEEAVRSAPEVLELQASVSRDDAELQLSRRQLKPDFMWEAAYQNRDGLDPMVMAGIGVRLPIYRERKQAQAIVQAERQAEASRQDLAGARLRIAAETRGLVARAARAEKLEQLYREAAIPQARSALEASSSAYAAGRVDFLTLLNDFTALLGYEVEIESQRAERVATLADLERLTTRELTRARAAGAEVTP